MHSFLVLLSIGIALSMDTFSLSLSIGTLLTSSKKVVLIASIVGIMHFFMPLIGLLIGKQILKVVPLSPDFLVGFILVILAILMLKDLIFPEKEKSFNLNFLGILAFALSVSLDSFSVGIGLKAITNTYFLASLIFSICSFVFTFMGLIIGKYSQQKIGSFATIIGIIILIIVALEHLLY